MTQQQSAVEPVSIANGVDVEDAFVDFNLNCSNPPDMCIILGEGSPLGLEQWEPVSGDRDDEYWIEENDAGLFRAWQRSLPVSEETGASTRTIEHETYGEVERYESLDHVVKRKVNEKEEDAVFSARLQAELGGYTTSTPIRVELGQEIVDRYINGPLGSETSSYWVAYRSHSGPGNWHRATSSREDFEGYIDCDVAFVHDSIYTWHPKRLEDVDQEDRVYE